MIWMSSRIAGKSLRNCRSERRLAFALPVIHAQSAGRVNCWLVLLQHRRTWVDELVCWRTTIMPILFWVSRLVIAAVRGGVRPPTLWITWLGEDMLNHSLALMPHALSRHVTMQSCQPECLVARMPQHKRNVSLTNENASLGR